MATYKYSANEFTNKEFFDTQLVHKNERAMIFAPKHAFVKGYMMLAPLRVVTHFEELNPEELESIAQLVGLLDAEYRARLESYAGYTIIANRGPLAGQRVPHTHVHFFPHAVDEQAHPLYQQIRPHDFGLREIDRDSHKTQIQDMLSKVQTPDSKDKGTEGGFSEIAGLIPEHQIIISSKASFFHDIHTDDAHALLSKLRSLLEKKIEAVPDTDGYTLIIPEARYAYRPELEGLKVSLVWRSLTETDDPLKRIPLVLRKL